MPYKLMMWFFHIKKKQITKDNPKGLHQKEQALMNSSDQKGERLRLLLTANDGSGTKSTKKASSIKRPHLHCLLVTACHGLILSQKAVLKSVEVLPLFCLTDASWILPPNVYLQYFEIWNLGRTFELNDYNALKSDMSSYDYSHLFYLVMEAKLVPDNFPESSKWCSYRWKIEKGKLL